MLLEAVRNIGNAASTFLFDTLIRVHEALDMAGEDYRVHLADSFMISDNAHAVHPNYTEKADPTNCPYLNEGIVLEIQCKPEVLHDAVSAAMFRDLWKAGRCSGSNIYKPF